jgi:hypothetical protein
MSKYYAHDIIKRSEHATSLLDCMRSELAIMNMLFVHDIIIGCLYRR